MSEIKNSRTLVGSKSRLGNLDLLRLFAALMVLVYHYSYVGHVYAGISPYSFPEIDFLTQHGWAGVSLFFMISGFVIAYSAERASAYDFMVSRVARLYPAFLFCMSLTAIVVLAAPQHFVEFQVNPARWLANLTMVSLVFKQPFVDGAYWSIVTEITFYFWMTILIALGVYQKHLLRVLAAWMLVSVANEFYFASQILNKVMATQYSCYFVLGILSYRAFSQNRGFLLQEMAIAAVALVLSLKSDLVVQTWMIRNYSYAAEFTAWGSILKTLIFLALLNLAVRIKPILSSNWCYLLGGLTYPLYLLHSNIGFTLFNLLHGNVNRWVAFALITSLMISLAYCVFRYVEPVGRKAIIKFANALHERFSGTPVQLAR
jgi:peptidoglycan/LPS O-acetylase OafA/YrhL